jgi:hypothetical protein
MPVSAPFHESTLFSHHALFRGSQNSDESVSMSDSYISPICECWLSNAYSSEVPERHIPTTNNGPALIAAEFCGCDACGSEACCCEVCCSEVCRAAFSHSEPCS